MAAYYKYSPMRNNLTPYTLFLSAESLEIIELELGTHVHVHPYLCTQTGKDAENCLLCMKRLYSKRKLKICYRRLIAFFSNSYLVSILTDNFLYLIKSDLKFSLCLKCVKLRW